MNNIFGTKNESILTVQGEGKVAVLATEADVSVAIEVTGDSAEETMNKISQKQTNILGALRAHQYGCDKLETGSFNLTPLYVFSGSKKFSSGDTERKIIGYKATSAIHFQTIVSQSGALIDVAVKAGANKISHIVVKPTEETLEKARLEAIKRACLDAKVKGQAALEGVGGSLGSILSVNIDKTDYLPKSANLQYRDCEMNSNVEVTSQEHIVTAKVTLKSKIN